MSKIIVADIHFLKEKEVDQRFVSVFPDGNNNIAYRASLDDLVYRSKELVIFVENLVNCLNQYLDSLHDNSNNFASRYIVYSVFLSITSIFIDRLIRLNYLINKCKCNLLIANTEAVDKIYTLSQIHSLSNTSWQFNQNFLLKIAQAFQIPSTNIPISTKSFEYPIYPAIKNTLFFSSSIRSKLYRKVMNFRELFNNTKKYGYLSLGFAYDDYYITKSGFYNNSGCFIRSKKFNLCDDDVKNKLMREDFKDNLGKKSKKYFSNFINRFKPILTGFSNDQLFQSWLDLVEDYFPISMLENLNINLKTASKHISLHNIRGITGSQLTSDSNLFLCFASSKYKKKIIGVQHAASFYGYIEDLSIAANFEYKLYSEMVTYGWNKVDSHLPKCIFKKLPCPKLSNILFTSNNFANFRCDVLFLSSIFHRFPHISSCGQPRVDFLEAIFQAHYELIQKLQLENITTHHKPYSKKSLDLYPNWASNLKKLGGKGYQEVFLDQKGLDQEIIDSYKIFIWDNLGTGAIECLVYKIPTLILWKKLYSRENYWSRPIIEQLKNVGIVHVSVDSLIKELKVFLKNPEKWMSDKVRVSAVKAFCQNFAFTDKEWPMFWMQHFKT